MCTKKWLYSPETYNILNYLTLEIKDKDIEREYELYRIKRFNDLYWPLVAILLAYCVVSWSAFLFGEGTLAAAENTYSNLLIIFVMTLFRYTCNRYSPQSWILCCFSMLLLV